MPGRGAKGGLIQRFTALRRGNPAEHTEDDTHDDDDDEQEVSGPSLQPKKTARIADDSVHLIKESSDEESSEDVQPPPSEPFHISYPAEKHVEAGGRLDFPTPENLGLRVPRKCTNRLWLVLFGITWIGMTAMSIVAFQSGDPDRLWRGADYLGNVCGKGGPRVPPDPYRKWEDLKYLFYPVKISLKKGEKGVSPGEALTMGVCVPKCPQAGDFVLSYSGAVLHQSMFDHITTFGRCIPIIDLYDMCEYNGCLQNITTDFSAILDASTFFFRGVAELAYFKWVVVICLGIALILTMLWLMILKSKRLIKPFTIFSVGVFQILLIAAGVFFWRYATGLDDAFIKHIYQALAVIFWLLAVAYLFAVAYLKPKFKAALGLIQVASKVQVSAPSLSLVPPLTVIVLIPVLLLAIIMATFIQTSGELFVETESPSDAPLDDLILPPGSAPIANHTSITGRNIAQDVWWKIPAHVYNFFVFIWSAIWLKDISFIVISMGCASCYWSCPCGYRKATPRWVVLRCLQAVLKNHLGTAAMGSLTLVGVFFCKILAKPVEWLVMLGSCRGEYSMCQSVVLASCAWITQLLSKDAYIMTAMVGDPFVTGAKRALFLVRNNIFHVGAIYFIGEVVMLFGKVLLTTCVLVVGWLLLSNTDLDSRDKEADTKPSAVIPMVVIGFTSWVVISIFSSGLQVSMETTLLCFCYDVHVNDGTDEKPLYMPSRLRRLMEKQLTWHLLHETTLLKGSTPAVARKLQGDAIMGDVVLELASGSDDDTLEYSGSAVSFNKLGKGTEMETVDGSFTLLTPSDTANRKLPPKPSSFAHVIPEEKVQEESSTSKLWSISTMSPLSPMSVRLLGTEGEEHRNSPVRRPSKTRGKGA